MPTNETDTPEQPGVPTAASVPTNQPTTDQLLESLVRDLDAPLNGSALSHLRRRVYELAAIVQATRNHLGWGLAHEEPVRFAVQRWLQHEAKPPVLTAPRPADRRNHFQCAHCNRICDWETREPISDPSNATVKTIGNRFCNLGYCLEAEAIIQGLPVDQIRAMHAASAPSSDGVFEAAMPHLADRELLCLAALYDHELHRRRMHPDFEYTHTTSARKSGDTPMPDGDGWEPNHCVDNHDYAAGAIVKRRWRNWERFDNYEENYWMRRKVFARMDQLRGSSETMRNTYDRLLADRDVEIAQIKPVQLTAEERELVVETCHELINGAMRIEQHMASGGGDYAKYQRAKEAAIRKLLGDR